MNHSGIGTLIVGIPLILLTPRFSAKQQVQGEANYNSLRQQIRTLYERQAGVKSFSQTALSADGRRLAWSVDGPNGTDQLIYVASMQQLDEPTRVSEGPAVGSCREQDPIWSPDSNRLAFLSDCQSPGQNQLFIANFSTDPTAQSRQPSRRLTRLSGFLSHPQWSPDGKDIAILFVDHASRAPTPMAAENKFVGVMDDFQNRDVQRLTVINVQTGNSTQVTPSGLYIFEFDWSPDGRQFVFTAAPPPGDDNWYVAQIYTQRSDQSEPSVIFKPRLQIALPRWSPDGKSIAFIQGLMSDEGGTGGEVYTLPATGGPARDVTPARASSPAWIHWISNDELLFTEFVGGATAIGTINVRNATVKRLWQGDQTIHAGSEESSLSVSQIAGELRTAIIRTSWSMLPEVWVGAVGKWKQVTSVNASANLPLPKFTDVKWKRDGFDVQGWLLFPQNYDATKRYPLLVAVHGGPAWIATPEWRAADFDTTLFTNFGYFLLFPNARGSYGAGEAFTQANRRDWGFGDLRDMVAGVDAVEKTYPVEDDRVGILGWSYGGSTAMMAITQTNRFHAAVAGAGAANWQSYYGQNSIDKWMIPYFGGSVYDDPAAYARCSAMTYIKRAKTPTLVLVGERDGEAPPAQSIEFWHALKELGVPTRLVIYSDEGHSFYKQTDQIDVTVRTLDWFDEYLDRH